MRTVVSHGAATLVFTGRFRPASFRAFAEHRARLLDLVASFPALDGDRIVVAVEGQHGFIDAFEMACSLGPIDCLVLEVERADEAAPRNRRPEQ